MTDYAISEKLVASAIADRGKAHPWDRIPVSKTALIVVDMQNYFVSPDSEGQTNPAQGIVPAINRLAAAMRELSGTVIWIQNTTTNTRQSWSVRHELLSPTRAEYRLAAMETGADGYQLWPTLDVRPEDTVLVKRFYSAFAQGSSDIVATLRAKGIEFVLIAGTYTNVCCQASAQDAMMLNFRTIMVSDCNAGSTPQTHAAALNNFFEFFGDVLSVDEVLERLEAATETVAA
jgi:ureidoacrylate peracid hydrolase